VLKNINARSYGCEFREDAYICIYDLPLLSESKVRVIRAFEAGYITRDHKRRAKCETSFTGDILGAFIQKSPLKDW